MWSLKLPKSLQQNKVLKKLSEYIQRSQIIFSSVIYKSNNGNYLIKKTHETPYIELDWKMYCIMRSCAKTIISSGQTLRDQQNTYQSLMTFGDQDLIQLYHLNRTKRQKIFVCTRQMSSEAISNMINPQYYQYVKLEDLDSKFNEPYEIRDAVKMIKTVEGSSPILLELGNEAMRNITEKQSKENEIVDLVIITEYEGYLPQVCMGNQFELDFLNKYSLAWLSDPITIDVTHKQSNFQSKVTFKVYASPTKAKQFMIL